MDPLKEMLDTIAARAAPRGGFACLEGGPVRPDATAWAALVLDAAGEHDDLVGAARQHLLQDQGQDGRVSLPGDSAAFWPTPLAILVWDGSPAHREASERAVRFLLGVAGRQLPPNAKSPLGHDTSLRGWPWIEDTSPWVDPTALALIALRRSGEGSGDRAREACRFLLDRQLRAGGWNYGNTTVFARVLKPAAGSTGIALCALEGLVPREEIAKSLAYLRGEAERLRTPFSLGWALLGLRAWSEPGPEFLRAAAGCLERRQVYGPFDTPGLATLAAACLAGKGLLNLLETRRPRNG